MYEYTDTDGDNLTIREDSQHVYAVIHEQDDDHVAQVAIPNAEAPSAALAVLTHAGEPQSDAVLQAIILLKEHEQDRARQKAEEEELWATAIRLRLAFMNGLGWDRARRELIEHDELRERFFRMARSVHDNYPSRPEAPNHAEHCAGLHSSGYCPPRIYP